MTDAEFARAFENGAIAHAQFHHRSHLRLAWVYVSESATVDEATSRMADTLRRFTASVGTPDSGRSPLDCERAGRRLRSSGG